ncbi:HTTM domain-containing protein [Streptomyces sp. NPDC048639]|uniref:HTTM domain-containing protein n=1 Tax=Streptomyces sp. NPDC048639 TaxID=3365581 RepID=UPI00371F44DD
MTPSPRPTASRTDDATQRLHDLHVALRTKLTEQPISLYAAAVLRIGYGLLYFAFLLREFGHRDEIWGPGSPWTPELATQLFDQTGWFSFLTLSDSRAYFEFCYASALVISALFALGWRTRAVSVLFAAVVACFHARAIYMADGGDNLMLLMAVYLCFTACGRRWSLDARRARLGVPSESAVQLPSRSSATEIRSQLGSARRILVTTLHNCGMFVIAVQVCLLYASTGLYKVQGETWANGTALHYVLNLDLFRPWPALSHMADGYPMMLVAVGYLTVLLQVAFPFTQFGRFKYPVLAVLLGMHIGIAILLGLPLFSGAMIVADAVFLPDRFYTFLARTCRRAFQRARSAGPGAPSPAEASLVPAQSGPVG